MARALTVALPIGAGVIGDGRNRRLAYDAVLVIIGFALLVALAVVKSEAITTLWVDPIFLGYTLLVTTFELSRVLGAMLYGRHVTRALKHAESIVGYEPTISFVIPCKNEEAAIRKTITQCFAAEYPSERLEVIVINDGSTDGTRDVLLELKQEYPGLVFVDWADNRGKRHGMAEGFRRAKGEIIIQLDSDSYIEPASVRKIIAPFIDRSVGAVCAHADPENADQNFLTRMQAAYYFMSFRILKAAESTFFTVFCCSGCSSAYRRSIVTPILDTWLNETFLGLPVTWGDDRALTNWVLRQGYRTIYTDRAQAYTICPTTLRQLFKQQVRWKKGWFVNSLFVSGFILKRDPFIAITYFFPLVFITLITPFMALRALVYNTAVHGVLPVYYLLGVFLIAAIITTYYRYIAPENKYWPYVFAWSALNLVILSFVLFYALATIQNRRWGTR